MPVVTLHPKTVAKLRAMHGRRTDYRDDVVRGLVLRVSSAGRRTWCVIYSRGRRHATARMTLAAFEERTLQEARAEARRILASAALGEDPAARALEAKRRPAGLTVEELAKRFLAEMARQKRLRPKTEKEYRRLLDVELIPKFGHRSPGEVTRGEVRELLRRIQARAPIVANRTFEMVRRLYSWAVSEDLVIGSPCVGMKRPSPEEPTDRVLSRDELRALQLALDELPSQSSDVVRLLLLTGVRLRMVLGMRRDELHDVAEEPPPGKTPEAARWIVAGGYGGRSKNRRSHVVPLSAPALAIVRRRLGVTPRGELLFPNRDGVKRPAVWLSSYVTRLRTRLARQINEARAKREEPAVEVPSWTVHQLRHTVRTHLREQLGVRDDVAELIVGHVRRGVAGTYNRSELLEERRAALVAWAEWLAKVKTEEPAKVLPWSPAREA